MATCLSLCNNSITPGAPRSCAQPQPTNLPSLSQHKFRSDEKQQALSHTPHTQHTSLHHPWEALKTRTTAPEHNQLNRVSLQSHRPHVAKGAHLTQAQPRHSAPSKKSGVRDTHLHTHTHTSLWFISQTPTHTHPRNDPSLFSWNHRCRQFLMYSPRLSSQPCFTTEESSAMLITGPPP